MLPGGGGILPDQRHQPLRYLLTDPLPIVYRSLIPARPFRAKILPEVAALYPVAAGGSGEKSFEEVPGFAGKR